MPVIAFPPQTLTPEDEAVITARLLRDRHYSCRAETGRSGLREVALFNGERRERGRVTKRRGIYSLLDAHGHPILHSRDLDAVLQALSG